MKIEYLASAEEDLEEILGYIAKANRDAALQMLEEFDVAVVQLEQNPLLGSVPKKNPQLEKLGWRFLDVKGYSIFYVIEGGRVEIRNVIHGWMTWEKYKAKAKTQNLSHKTPIAHKKVMELLKTKILGSAKG